MVGFFGWLFAFLGLLPKNQAVRLQVLGFIVSISTRLLLQTKHELQPCYYQFQHQPYFPLAFLLLYIAHTHFKLLGKTSVEKSRLLSGIAQISKPPPPPNSGNLVLFFPDVKMTFYANDRKKVAMMIMIVAMTIMIVVMVIFMIMMKK